MPHSTLVGLGLWLSVGALACDSPLPSSASSAAGVARAQLTAAEAPAACGGKGLPDCPLQHWMKATLQTYQREANYERLANALDQLQTRTPQGFDHWGDIAGRAAAAARKQDADAVRQACKSCHEEHRARYRRERRSAPWQ